MRRKRFLALVLSLTLAVGPAIPVMAEKDVAQTGSGSVEETNATVGGYIPSDLDYNTPVYEPEIATYANDTLESKYPANGVSDIEAKYPSNRNQGEYGTCWAFSSLGLMEFDLINKGMFTKDNDLSELQLVYFTYNFLSDPLGGTADDKGIYYKENASESYLKSGGNYEMATRRLGQWIGPVNETEVPYKDATSVYNNGLSDEYAYTKDVAHLENTYVINIKENPVEVKKQIKEHGAAGIMYSNYVSGMNWNDAKVLHTYYDAAGMTGAGGRHAVMIVGWDDSFSKDNFTGSIKPERDGAWLVRNSWGIEQNYFWMSYDTNSLSDSAWIFDASTDDGYDNNYQLDGGIESSIDFENYKNVSNVYTAQEKDGVSSETLKAVSVSFTHVTNVNYTIEVYTDLTNTSNPYSGVMQEEATTTGSTTYAGIYSIPLKREVNLKPGSNFAIVVKPDKISVDYEKSCQTENMDRQPIWDCSVSMGNGKSFNGSGNYLYSWSYGNFCIKAFTADNKSHSITYELDGGTNDSENPTSYMEGNEAIELKDPTKEGYRFDGWYLDKDYTTKITEIPANATEDYTLYAKWLKETSIGEKLTGCSVSLNGTTEINFYMKLDQELAANKDAYLEFTMPNGTMNKVYVKDVTPKNGYYVFPCSVVAKEMTSDIKAQMKTADQEGTEYTYSVKEYADYILSQEQYKGTVADTVKAMLNYGAASQVYFNYKTDKLANADLSREDQGLKDVDFSDYAIEVQKDEQVTGISYYGSSLVLDAAPIIKHYFKLDTGEDINSYVFECSSGNNKEIMGEPKQEPKVGENYYSIEIENTRAYDLENKINLTVKRKGQEGETSGLQIKYGVFSYAERLMSGGNPDEKIADIMKAMYAYGEMAKKYANENP